MVDRRRRVALGPRALGVVVAVCLMALWATFLYRNPYAAPAEGRAFLFGSLMMLASAISAVAAAYGAHLGMYLLFFASFFPVGLYVILSPGLFRAIGWLDFAYLASALLVHRAVMKARSVRATSGVMTKK